MRIYSHNKYVMPVQIYCTLSLRTVVLSLKFLCRSKGQFHCVILVLFKSKMLDCQNIARPVSIWSFQMMSFERAKLVATEHLIIRMRIRPEHVSTPNWHNVKTLFHAWLYNRSIIVLQSDLIFCSAAIKNDIELCRFIGAFVILLYNSRRRLNV